MKFKGLLLSVLLFYSTFVNAHTGQEYVVVDGIRFSVSYGIIMGLGEFEYYDITAWVVESETGTYSGDIVIPEKIHFKSQNFDLETEVGVREISGAFTNCTQLTSVTIPSSITQISSGSFDGCDNLKDVYCYLKNAPLGRIFNLSSTPYISNATLHVHGLSIEEYKETWSGFKKYVDIDNLDFTITYYVDEELYKTVNYKYDDIIVPEAEPMKEDMLFSGWKMRGYSYVGHLVEIPQTMPAKNIEFLGTFRNGVYKLIYKVDGEEYKSLDVKCYNLITPEAEPTKKGMTFSGWGGLPETMPEKDVVVTGTFSWSKDMIDGVIYEVSDTTNNNAAVIGNDNVSGDVKVVSPVKFDYDYSITDIVDFSFKNNTDITSVVIPESVRKIGDEAFYGCKNLAKIELGKSVNQIEPRAFAGIDKLTDVTIYAKNVPEIDRTAFENSYIEDYVTLHVPDGCVERYKAVAPWKNFKSIEVIAGTKVLPAPAIEVKDGKLTFSCEEEGVEFHYEITPLGQNAGKGNNISLSQSYRVKVYASKEGCLDSETTTKEITIKKGDVNCDGSVNAADVVSLTNIIMNPEVVKESEAETEEENIQ